MAAARGTSLFPPDPRYIPGYEGFVPQFSYQFGETFGKTTFRLLTDPGVRKSPHSLLAPLPKLKFIEDFTGTRHEVPDYIPVHPGERGQSQGSPAQGGCAQPGPSPGQQQQHRVSHVAIQALKGTRTPGQQRFIFIPASPTYSLVDPYMIYMFFSRNCSLFSPPEGYTGYIPRYAWITGVNYIQGVKDAMNEFDRNQFLLQNPVSEFGKRLPQSYWPNNRIYTSAGLIPFYTGFVPSNYALTFGNSTRKAFQKEQRRRACALRKKNFNDACTAFEVTLEQEEEHNTDRRSFE
uniref:Ciliary microtubule inner protein 2A-C-like domain-containing protein n=1 Tax=Nothoprocta perdicaria TaxID=30464 RepID=A0A8C6Z585_NOTPE